MAERAVSPMTVDEFEAWADARADGPWELVDGEPRLMAGPSEAHGLIQAAVIIAMARRLPPGCRMSGAARMALDGGNERVPDAAIVCGKSDGKRLAAPTFLIEVLSPATADQDLVVKRLRYIQIESVREIWYVDSRRRYVHRLSRQPDGTWISHDFIGEAAIPSEVLTSPVSLSEIYDGIPLDDDA